MTTNCTVCLEPIDRSQNNYCVSQCNHSFHLDCLLTVSKNSFKCPICKNDLAEQEEDFYEQEPIDINVLLDLVIVNLNESKLKTKLIEIKTLLDNSLENNIKNNINNYIEDFNELCYEYDCKYQIDYQLTSYLLKIKTYFIDLEELN